MRRSLVVSCLSLIVFSGAVLMAQTKPQARLILRTDQRVYGKGEKIKFEYQLQNDGVSPFYVNRVIAQVGGMDAGVRIELVDDRGHHVPGQIVADTFPPDYKHMTDVVQYVKENWLLLLPRTFYGTSGYYGSIANLKPGAYRLSATYFSYILSFLETPQKEHLYSSLQYPLMVDTIQSNEVQIQIRESR